jgi:hypothetical protein
MLSEGNGGKNSICFSEGQKDFESAVRSLLVTQLPQDMREIFGIEISVEIKAVRQGSLVVFFGVVIAGIGALSRYKNLYDSVELVRRQADQALCSLKKRFGEFRVDVFTLQPRFQDPYDRHPFFNHKMLFEEFGLPSPSHRSSRDGLFYVLLVWGILAFIIIAVLVYAAVAKTYFP